MAGESASNKPDTFVDRCLNGLAFVDEFDDYVDIWYEQNSGIPLHEFLGFTLPEYGMIVEKPQSIKFIMHARETGRKLTDYRDMADSFRIAARTMSADVSADLIQWLKSTGRLGD